MGDETGVNRVTQNFINNGTYIGGQVTIFPDTPPFGLGFPDGSYGVLNPATAYTVKLPWYKGLLSPGDSGRTGRLQSQLITTLSLGPDTTIINRTYFENANDRQYNLWGYSEYVPLMGSFQDRAELHTDFTVAGIDNKIIAGGDFRYTRIVSYQDYAVEPFFYFDLYQPASNMVLPDYAEVGNTLGAPYLVPGHSKYGAYLVNDSANQDSHIYDSAAFVQDTITLNKKLFAIAGFRLDHIKADDGNPALNQVDDPVTGAFYSPGMYVPRGSIYYAEDSVNNPSYFGSLVFKATETSSFYVSYNNVNAVLEMCIRDRSHGLRNVFNKADAITAKGARFQGAGRLRGFGGHPSRAGSTSDATPGGRVLGTGRGYDLWLRRHGPWFESCSGSRHEFANEPHPARGVPRERLTHADGSGHRQARAPARVDVRGLRMARPVPLLAPGRLQRRRQGQARGG